MPQWEHNPRSVAKVGRVSYVPNPNVGIGFLIVSNPAADLGRIARLRWVAAAVRLVSRLCIAVMVVVGFPLVLGAVSHLVHGQLPPMEYAQALGVWVLATGAAVGTWVGSDTIERHRRVLASHDGIDRNPKRTL